MLKRTKTNNLIIFAPLLGIILFVASLLFTPLSIKKLRKNLFKKPKRHRKKQTLAAKVKHNLKKLSW